MGTLLSYFSRTLDWPLRNNILLPPTPYDVLQRYPFSTYTSMPIHYCDPITRKISRLNTCPIRCTTASPCCRRREWPIPRHLKPLSTPPYSRAGDYCPLLHQALAGSPARTSVVFSWSHHQTTGTNEQDCLLKVSRSQ